MPAPISHHWSSQEGVPLAGCHVSVGFPGRCQHILHTIDQAKRVCPLQGATPAWGSLGGASIYCTQLIKPRGCAPCRVPRQRGVPWEVPAPIAHNWSSQEDVPLAGCHASVGFPGRCQLLLHTIDQAKRVCPLQGATPAWGSLWGASSYCTQLIKPRGCAPCRVPRQRRVPWEVPAPIAHNWSSQEGVPLAGCHASVGFPVRCQLLLHTIDQAKRVCPLQGATPA